MLEKINQLAEQAAASVSRRQFLGRLGRGAAAVAAAAGGLLAMPAPAQAAGPCPAGMHRSGCGQGGGYLCCPQGTKCVGSRGFYRCA